MNIRFRGEVVVEGFQQQSDGQESPWSLRLSKQDSHIVVKLYWGDKESATHIAFVDLKGFKDMVASL